MSEIEDDLIKARSLCETLMRRALAVEQQGREMVKALRDYSVSIERQTTAMKNILQREMKDYPEH